MGRIPRAPSFGTQGNTDKFTLDDDMLMRASSATDLKLAGELPP